MSALALALLLATGTSAEVTVKLPESGLARIGSMAPSFGLWDLKGEGPYILEKMRKEPTPAPLLITFGASWCKPCRTGLPRLKALADKHPEMRLVLIDVDNLDAVAEAQKWVGELDLKGPVLFDKFKTAATRYGAWAETKSSLPRTFLVDEKGRVRAIYSVEGADLEQVIEADLRQAIAAPGIQPASVQK